MKIAGAWIGAMTGLALLAEPLAAVEFDTAGRSALIVDHTSGMVLMEKNADLPLPPASMSKLMTLWMLFEALEEGRVAMDTTFTVSERARNMGGSRMFVELGSSVPVRDLILGVTVHSGNDASVVIAEGLAGSEEAFARRMTERGREIGLVDSVFRNATGWPADGHVMSARDLVHLARLLIEEYPDYYPYFAEAQFTWNGITQRNRLPLIGAGLGVDGLKTGHTSEAGYGLVASAERAGRRVVVAVTGLPSERARADEARRMIDWAFREFDPVSFFEAGETVGEAEVWIGEQASVPLVAPRDITVLVPAGLDAPISAHIAYSGPIEAPIAEGQPIAELVVEIPDRPAVRFDLIAGAAVDRGGFLARMNASAVLLADRARGYIVGN